MVRISIYILAFYSFIGISKAQTSKQRDSTDLKINIVGNYGDFLIDLTRSVHSIGIKIQVKDSVDEKKLAADPKYRRVIRQAKRGRMAITKANCEAFVPGHRQYTVYSTDSINVKVDSVIQFNNLLSSISTTSNGELVNSDVSYLDGFEIQLFILAFGMSRELTAHSPSKKFSPKIEELLHQLVLLSKSTKLHLLKRTVIRRY